MYIFLRIIHTNTKQRKGGVGMDEARKKLRICLICIVIAAVVVGCIYYYKDVRGGRGMMEGTLVLTEMEKRG